MNPQSAREEDELSGLRVLAHPLRLRMLSLLTGTALSAMELSRELGISQALASYHLRQLHGAGVIELAEVRSRRGGQERRFVYRPAAPDSPSRTSSLTDGLALFTEAVCVELRRRSQEAESGGDRLGVDAELWVDPAQWAEAVDAMRAASIALHRQAKPPRTAGTIRVSVSAVLFPMTTHVTTTSGRAQRPR
ncbi:MAG: ArsR/SmtB family transcription factor [Streptosporangiaceae bacterium]